MNSIQITLKQTEPLINFVDKFSNGMSGRLLTLETNGFGIYTHFGKMFIREGDWLVYDGYAFIPYSSEHYKVVAASLTNTEKERDYWKQRCEAAEDAYSKLMSWYDSNLTSEGFQQLSEAYEKWQQLKLQIPKP